MGEKTLNGRFLYVIRQVDVIDDVLGLRYMKIGRSDWPRSRFPAIQNGCPFELELVAWFKDMGNVEKAAHKALARWHVRGEWFLVPDRFSNGLIAKLKSMADDRGLEWKDMSTITWAEVDLELDKIETSDERGLVEVFLRFVGTPIRHESGRRGHINVTNFSTHVSMPRHQLQALVDEYELTVQEKETA